MAEEWGDICCAIDFSEPSRTALQEAAKLARRFGANLTLLHVHDAKSISAERLLEEYEKAAPGLQQEIGKWQAEAEAITGRPVRPVILVGGPAAEIVRFLREGTYDLVVMATRGLTGLKHVLLGSVAERVVREAECPVLVIRRRPAPKSDIQP